MFVEETSRKQFRLRRLRKHYDADRLEAILDRAERAVEVAVLSKPESDANLSNAEAIALLTESSQGVTDMVALTGSILFIKMTGPQGTTVFTKTLSPSELRRLEAHEIALASPVEALELFHRHRDLNPPET